MVNGLINFVSANLITGNNFIMIFIALVVIFFLLGLILGLLINSGKRNRNKKDRPASSTESTVEKSTQADPFIQDTGARINQGNNRVNQKPPVNKYRSYNKYW